MQEKPHVIDRIFMTIGGLSALVLGISSYRIWRASKRYEEAKRILDGAIDFSNYDSSQDVTKVKLYLEKLKESISLCLSDDTLKPVSKPLRKIGNVTLHDFKDISNKYEDALEAIERSSPNVELDTEILKEIHSQIIVVMRESDQLGNRYQANYLPSMMLGLGALATGGILYLAYKSERDRVKKIEEALRKMNSSISFSGYDRGDERIVRKFWSDLDKLVRDTIISYNRVEVADYNEADAVMRMHQRRLDLLSSSFKDAVKAIKRSSPDKDNDLQILKSYYRDFVAISTEQTQPSVNRNLNQHFMNTGNIGSTRVYSDQEMIRMYNAYQRAIEDDKNYDRELAKRGLDANRSTFNKSAARNYVGQARLRGKVGGRVRGGIAGGTLGAGGGLAAGAATGAALGSVVPGAGTIIGGIAGGVIGAGAGLLGGAAAGAHVGGNYYAKKMGNKALSKIQRQRMNHLDALDTEKIRRENMKNHK